MEKKEKINNDINVAELTATEKKNFNRSVDCRAISATENMTHIKKNEGG